MHLPFLFEHVVLLLSAYFSFYLNTLLFYRLVFSLLKCCDLLSNRSSQEVAICTVPELLTTVSTLHSRLSHCTYSTKKTTHLWDQCYQYNLIITLLFLMKNDSWNSSFLFHTVPIYFEGIVFIGMSLFEENAGNCLISGIFFWFCFSLQKLTWLFEIAFTCCTWSYVSNVDIF